MRERTYQRRYDLDWLRVSAFTLLILFHTGMMFNTWDWHVKNPETSMTFEYVMRFLNQWRMPLLFFISGAAVWFAKEREAAELELQAAQLQSRLAEAQLNVLRGEVQPHFLFNTLNMISTLMYEDVGRADRMITLLSHLLRTSLDHAHRPKVPLAREVDFARAYLEIMSSRFEDRLQHRFDVPSRLLTALVPSFILQPLVENAVKHGDLGDRGSLVVIVSASSSASPGHLHSCIFHGAIGLHFKTPVGNG